MRLSIIIPVFNENKTIIPLLEKINGVQLEQEVEKELIIVDDASTDTTVSLVEKYLSENLSLRIHLLKHEINSGKGSCIHTGIKLATGDYILVQDADLEYDPAEYNALLQPALAGRADVVYGSRFVGGRPHRILFFWHSIGNKIITALSNMLTNLNLTDIENGYKLFRADILKSLDLQEKRFGFEPEVTAKIAAVPGIRIYEIGVAYYGRTYEEGKKINWKDGLSAVFSIFKYNLFTKKSFQPSSSLFSNKIAYIVMLLFFVAGSILIFIAKGTGDEGDSIMHYLYARHSWQHYQFFFLQWAKPLYVFLASPFAQLGMTGMKFFNLSISTLTLYFSFFTAKKLLVPNLWLVPLCMVFAPYMMIITLSGLTEPLFALWMIVGIYWLVVKRYMPGLLWLSFLPFVRSEGLIILCVLLLYLLFKKLFKYIPLLFVGHFFYSVAGYFIYHDFLWVFNTLSYATLSSGYGSGPLLHFFHHMPEVLGKPVCSFLVVGLIYGLIKLLSRFLFKQKNTFSNEEIFLVYGVFIAYFVGHSAFWALGIFNSFGLWRVMVGVFPLIAIISARGFNLIASISKGHLLRYVLYICIALIMVYPFLGRIYSFNWKRDFSLKADQAAEDRLGQYVKTNFPDYKNRLFYYQACYLSLALDVNYFDTTKHRILYNSFQENKFFTGNFIVWDDWFARVDGGVEEAQVLNDPRFELIKVFEEKDVWDNTRKVELFRVK